MSRASIKKWVTGCVHSTLGLFRTRISDLRCTSLVAGKGVNLPGLILGAADEALITFTLQHSAASFGAWRRVPTRLVITPSSRGSGPAGIVSPNITQPSMQHAAQVEKFHAWRKSCFWIHLNPQFLAGRECVELEIRRGGKAWRRLRFRVIGESEAQHLRLERLRAQEQQLWIQSADRCYVGDVVAEAGACLAPEFTLVGSELDAVLPPCEARVSMSLTAGKTRTPLGDTPVVINDRNVRVRAHRITIKDCPALWHPGRYRLVASLGERDLISFGVRITAKAEWRDQLRVRAVLEAETADGQIRRERTLRWGKHSAFCPLLRIQTDIPAPDTVVRGVARILLNQTVLRCEEFVIRLGQKCTQVRLQRFSLLDLQAQTRGQRVCLLLAVKVDEAEKVVRPVLILPPGDLTNFEGQLTQDSDKLPVDEAAYESILHRLVPGKAARRVALRACNAGRDQPQ